MKWKDLMAHSLPRSWSKLKKRSSIIPTSEKAKLVDDNANNFTEIRIQKNPSKEFKKIAEDCTDLYVKQQYYIANNLKSEEEDKYSCQKRVIYPNSPSKRVPNEADFVYAYNLNNHELLNKSKNDEYTNMMTPRTRTRIKTNPWLPSPKIPTKRKQSPTTSCATSSYSSAGSTNSSPTSSLSRSRSRSSSFDGVNLITTFGGNGSESSVDSAHERSDFEKSFEDLQLSPEPCRKKSQGSDGNLTVSSTGSHAMDAYGSYDDINCTTDSEFRCVSHNMNIPEADDTYEAEFESQMETFDSECEDEFSSNFSLENFVANMTDSWDQMSKMQDYDNNNQFNKNVNDNIICEKQRLSSDAIRKIYHEDQMNTSTEHDFSESEDELDYYLEDYEGCTDDDLDNKKWCAEEELDNRRGSTDDELDIKNCNIVADNDPVAEAAMAICDDDNVEEEKKEEPKRSIQQIRSSLVEKVHKLRQEKHYVAEKIRVAQEEEKFVAEEKLKIKQQETQDQRKTVLLRTLADLRKRLESQCQRLQNNYSQVLTMQQKFVTPNLKRKFIKPVDNKESPF